MSVSILSYTDAGSGVASITLEGAVNGTLTWLAGHKPDGSDRGSVAPVGSGLGPYSLTLGVGIWHIWAQDGDGLSPAAPLWLGVGDYTDEVSQLLQQILLDHIPAINARISRKFPNGTIKQVVTDTGMLVEEWPAIVVAPVTQDSDWAFMPHGSQLGFSTAISVFIHHNELPTQVDLATQIADACKWILSQPAYNDLTLPSGLGIRNCRVTQVRGTPGEEDGGGGFLSSADFKWSGAGFLQVTQ